MGSIPLPALQVQPMKSPLDSYSKALSIQGQQQQQQVGAEQLKQEQIQTQQAQQQQKDQQTVMQTLGQTGGDVDKAIPLLSGKVSPKTMMDLQRSHLETRKTLAEIDDKKLATIKDQNDRYSALVQQASAMPPDQYAQMWPQIATQSNQIHPEYQLDPSKPIPQQQLGGYAVGLMTTEQYLKQEADRRAQIKATDEHNAASAELPGKQISSLQQQVGFYAPKLAKSANKEEYGKKLDELPHAIAKQFPDAEHFDPNAVLQAGMTASQVATIPVHTAATAEGVFVVNHDGTKGNRIGSPTKALQVNNMGGVGGTDRAKSIGDAIIAGDQQPDLSGLGRGDTGAVRDYLAKQHYPLAVATTDWKAVQKHISTLNGPQQTRLVQSISSAGEMIDKVESLYSELKTLAPRSGFQIVNKATMIAMKNLPGKPGAVAHALESQIADLNADLGNIYMGGNSPTDQALKLASKSFSGDWNDDTMSRMIPQARANVKIRQNSVTNSRAMGTSGTTNYAPPQQPQGGGKTNDPLGIR